MSLAEFVDLSAAFGPLFLGAFANSMLFALELAQFFRFFTSDRSDPILLKLTLVAVFLNDLLATVGGAVGVYQIFVVGHGNLFAIVDVSKWLLPVYAVTTMVGVWLCQLFLVSRIFRLTRNWWTTGALVVCATGGFGVALSTANLNAVSLQTTSMMKRVTIWFSTAAGTDILISMTLLYLLYKARQEAKRFKQSTLKAPLTRLMVRTIETGSVTSAVALLGLVLYHVFPGQTYYLGVLFPIGRVYTLTVYFCIFSTNRPRDDSSSGQNTFGTWADTTRRTQQQQPTQAATAHEHTTLDITLKQLEENKLEQSYPLAIVNTKSSIGDMDSAQVGYMLGRQMKPV